MPLAPNTRLRKGDIVAVHAVVDYVPTRGDQIYHLKVAGEYSPIFRKPDQMAALIRRRFDPGERVGTSQGEGLVLAVFEDAAWIKLDGAPMPVSFDIRNLALIDLPEPDPAPEDSFDTAPDLPMPEPPPGPDDL